jgi:menaquinone-9 beta-reductase
METFDVVTVGGGMGASALAISLARHGIKVLILEKEKRFQDRVRGEALVPWGVAEARQLGIEQVLLNHCALEVPWVEMGFGPRNLVETTSQRAPTLTFHHPEMQEALLAEAAQAGAEVRRGVTVESVEGSCDSGNARVTTRNGKAQPISARLVVAADGRGSAVRRWCGFLTKRDSPQFQFAGVLLTGVATRSDMVTFLYGPDLGLVIGVVPQTGGRCRAYLGHPCDGHPPFSGSEKLPAFLAVAGKVAPYLDETYAKAKGIGPLATFDASAVWAEHPYRQGVALLGDAAGTSDPSFGQGMATTLRDARTLSEALIASSDWEKAGHEYARQHDHYFGTMHKICGWVRTLFQDPSPSSRALRERALPRIAEDLTRVPDHIFGGPELPADDSVRARLFAED